MTFYDSSLLIDYLDNRERAVTYVEERSNDWAVTSDLVMFEVLQGEVHKSGPTDFDGIEEALGWLDIADTSGLGRRAAELQVELESAGNPLTARDTFIAAGALETNEPLAASDADFDSEALREQVPVDIVR